MSNSDSDDNQGFVANHIKIDQHSVVISQKPQSSLKQFQPHYFSGQGVFRKEPQQLIAPFKNVHSRPRSYPTAILPIQREQDLPNASELYGNNKLYYLAYRRFRQPFGEGQKQTFKNSVQLNFCQNQHDPHLRTLKEWDQQSINDSSVNDTCLLFDSHFEGGNLLCAFKSKKQLNTYTLFMQNDTNTYGYNQWFYFSVRNMKPNTKYVFRIANFKKPYSFFNNGLQPLLFSLQKSRKEEGGWYRDGHHISYFPSEFAQPQSGRYYTLQFTIFFDYAHDYVTISPYAPYSYSKLISSLKRLEKVASDHCLSWKLKTISRSLAYNQVPYLVLSNKNIIRHSKKKIIILARQHSGQTWSSYLVQNIIQQLVEQNSSQSKWLLQNYDFHIFPMVNVDGVIYGNFRCDLAGYDLNRTWKTPSKQIQPQVYHIKNQISKLQDRYGIQMCMDLHTHSKQYGAFAYCCVQSQQCRQLPNIISSCSPFFRYKACTFGISGDKKYTARSAIFGITNSLNVLTIELSAYGFKLPGRRYPFAYTPAHIKNIGRAILKGFFSYKSSKMPILEDEQIQIEEEDGPLLINTKEIIDTQRQSTIQEEEPVDGSDSQPEADQIELQIKLNTIFPQNFREEELTVSNTSKGNKSLRKSNKNNKKFNRTVVHKSKLDKRTSFLKDHSLSREDIRQSANFEKIQPQTIDQVRDHIPSVSKVRKQMINIPQSQHRKHSINTQKVKRLGQQKVSKPLNLIQFSLKKLPISVPQKLIPNFPNHHIMLDEQGPLIGTHSYAKKQQSRFDKTFSTYEAMVRPRARMNSKKQGVVRDNSRLQDQLPFLCIMSQNKKQLQLQKIKQKQQRSFQRKMDPRPVQVATHQNHHKNHHNTLNKIKNKQKQLELIAKIGFEQYTRYFSQHPAQKKQGRDDNKFI